MKQPCGYTNISDAIDKGNVEKVGVAPDPK